MIENITENVVRIHFKGKHTCNSYFIKDKRILIDTGSLDVVDIFKKSLPIAAEDVSMVLLTHLHHDHIGIFSLFQDSPFYASKEAINSFQDSPSETVLNVEVVKLMYEKDFLPKEFNYSTLKDLGFTIYQTPGHAEGSVCILYEDVDNKILFSGDLFFDPEMNVVGRTDLPTSNENKLKISLRKMSGIKYDILCPGHGKVMKNWH